MTRDRAAQETDDDARYMGTYPLSFEYISHNVRLRKERKRGEGGGRNKSITMEKRGYMFALCASARRGPQLKRTNRNLCSKGKFCVKRVVGPKRDQNS